MTPPVPHSPGPAPAGWGEGDRAAFGFPAPVRTSFPRFPAKLGEASVTGPEPFAPAALEQVPRVAVLCYTSFLAAALAQVRASRPESRESRVVPGLHYLEDGVALVENTSLLGAPMATVQLERLIHLGIRSFIVLGIAGSLREGVEIGDVVVGDRAVRDEGTSHHYLPPSDFAWPAPGLTDRVIRHLRATEPGLHVGGTWTTDAIFRETPLEIRALAEAGILTVEMEAAALFSVARFRGVDLAAVFVVSDRVHRESWERGQEGPVLETSVLRVLSSLATFDPGTSTRSPQS